MSGETATKARSRVSSISRAALTLLAICLVLIILTRRAHIHRVTPTVPAQPPLLLRPSEKHREAFRASEGRAAEAQASALIAQPTPTEQDFPCEPREHVELWGQVMRPGLGPGAVHAPSVADCCKECARTRGCNAWVACIDANACGTQCWLKWQANPTDAVAHATGAHVPWTSGAMRKDFIDDSRVFEPGAAQLLVLTTPRGELRIRLRPEWSQGSVRYARIVGRYGLCTVKCVFYRAEPGFLLQGALHAAAVAANNETLYRSKGVAMERGDVAWAGGFAGPDFFITHRRVPGFGGQHVVWGSLADDASLAVLDKLVDLPAHAPKGGGMRMIDEPAAFEARVEDGAGGSAG